MKKRMIKNKCRYTKAFSGVLVLLGSVALFSPIQVHALEVSHVIENMAQDSIRGIVRSAATKKPLAGVNVKLDNFAAAISDSKGQFAIQVRSLSGDVLNFSFDGYQNREVSLRGSQSDLMVDLYESNYQDFYVQTVTINQRKALANETGAKSSVFNQGTWAIGLNNPDNALQGKIAGLNVIRRSSSPGAGASLFSRGFSSLYTNSSPLIVVDGMLYDNETHGGSLIGGYTNNAMSLIDIKDIDNMTFERHGAGQYGTKGANGILYITTSRAKELATKIDFATYVGHNMELDGLPVMQANDFRLYLLDLLRTNSSLSTTDIENMPYVQDESNAEYYTYHNNTDWQKAVMRNSMDQNYFLKVTGGDNIATYGLSMAYLNKEGVIQNTDMTRYQVRFNANLNLLRNLKANANISLARNISNLRNEQLNSFSPLALSLIKAPILYTNELSESGVVSPNLSDYDIFGVNNPIPYLENGIGNNKNFRFFGSIGLQFEFSSVLSLNGVFGLNVDNIRQNTFFPRLGALPLLEQNVLINNRSSAGSQRLNAFYTDVYLAYVKNLAGQHDLNVRAGVRYQNNTAEGDYTLGFNSAADEFTSISHGNNSLRQVGGHLHKWNWFNTYVSADYSFRNKYLAKLDVSLDASSRFGQDIDGALAINGVNFATLPNLSLGWLISSEDFMQDVSLINLLKLRASYGLSGNDNISYTANRLFYTSQNMLGMQGLVRGNIANPGLKWETIAQANLGLDVALLNQRLNLATNLFRNTTRDMVLQRYIPFSSTFPYLPVNAGEMETNGWDVSLNARVVNKEDLKWDVGFNIGSYRNKVTKLIDNKSFETSFGQATYITQVGQPANQFYGFKTDGVYATTTEASAYSYVRENGNTQTFRGGDVRFVDLNGDKIIDEDDRQIIGNPNPDFYGGFNTGVSWKRISLNTLFTFSKGNDVYNATRSRIESMDSYSNQLPSTINRWRVEGQVTDMPRVAYGDPSGNARFSERWIEDGSYLRLRTVSLGYDVPLKGKTLRYTNIYITGENLITWTKYLGYDPEFIGGNSPFQVGVDTGLNPLFRSIQLGIRIGL